MAAQAAHYALPPVEEASRQTDSNGIERSNTSSRKASRQMAAAAANHPLLSLLSLLLGGVGAQCSSEGATVDEARLQMCEVLGYELVILEI
jgi:hypothetical protein